MANQSEQHTTNQLTLKMKIERRKHETDEKDCSRQPSQAQTGPLHLLKRIHPTWRMKDRTPCFVASCYRKCLRAVGRPAERTESKRSVGNIWKAANSMVRVDFCSRDWVHGRCSEDHLREVMIRTQKPVALHLRLDVALSETKETKTTIATITSAIPSWIPIANGAKIAAAAAKKRHAS